MQARLVNSRCSTDYFPSEQNRCNLGFYDKEQRNLGSLDFNLYSAVQTICDESQILKY